MLKIGRETVVSPIYVEYETFAMAPVYRVAMWQFRPAAVTAIRAAAEISDG